MSKADLREFTDDELSLQVMNDEYLYTVRNATYLEEILDEYFIYTEEQLHVLKNDLFEEEGE